MSSNKAVVLLSGGQDSTTSLYWAIEKYGRENIIALNILYGQRHSVERESARKIAELAKVPLTEIETDIFQILGDSALVNPSEEISEEHSKNKDLPASFVPGRNLLFLTIAGAFAYKHEARIIVTGVCETDYSGYPDCRRNTIDAMELALGLGMQYTFLIQTPLMFLSKAKTVELAKQLPGCWEALKYSHTCYQGVFPPCKECPACLIREKGFEEAGEPDPIMERL